MDRIDSRQRGFTFIELTLVLGIISVLSVFAARFVVNEAEMKVSESTGVYQNMLGDALDAYMRQNTADLSANVAIAGFANPLAPTIAELKAAGRLPPSFPTRTPFLQTPLITITRTGCPGVGCRLEALAYSSTPLRENNGQPKFRTTMDIRMNTQGGVSADVVNPAILKGAVSGGIPNPLGAVGGVYGVYRALDTALYPDYVKRFDTRTTTLENTLTLNSPGGGVDALVANGPTKLNGDVAVNGTLTNGGCFSVTATGDVSIGCNGVLNAIRGTFRDAMGNVIQINTAGSGEIIASGIVTGNGGLQTASGRLFTAADPNGIRVTSGALMEFGSALGAGAPVTMASIDNGDVVASRNVAGQRVSVKEQVNPGAPCANTSGALASGTEVASLFNGGLAVCQSGKWVAVQAFGTHLGGCLTDGSTGVDPSSGKALMCRGGRWVWMNSYLSNFVLIKTVAVVDGRTTVPATRYTKPVCDATGATGTGVPLLLLMPSNEATNDQAFNRWAIDIPGAPGQWEIRLENGSNVPLSGATAIGAMYCWYP